MDIAIIGAGAVGAALAEGWTRAGHRVVLGVRDARKPEAQALAARLGAGLADAGDAAAMAEAAVLAVPWAAAEAAAEALGDMGGRLLIDATNPLVFRDGALRVDHPGGLSGAERIAARARGARVVKTLNQVGAEIMADADALRARPCMFVAGDDAAANAQAAALVADLGFEVFEAGGLAQARHLEHFAMVWINQAMRRGAGRDWAFGVIRKG